MGLLDVFNTYEGQQALGLLAAAGGRSDGAGFGQRLQEGLGSAEKWKQQQTQAKMQMQQMQMHQMQMEQMQQQAKEQAQIKALIERNRIAAKPGVAPIIGDLLMPPHLRAGILPSGGSAPTPAGFDREGFAAGLEGIDPLRGLAYQASIAKDNTPISVAKGTTLLDKRTLKPIFSPQEDDSTDPKIKQYEYAKKGGYKGTFEQFVTLGPTIMAAAQAPLREAQIGNIRDENAYNLPAPRAAGGGSVSVTTPDGRSYSFPNQAAANSFKMKAGIR